MGFGGFPKCSDKPMYHANLCLRDPRQVCRKPWLLANSKDSDIGLIYILLNWIKHPRTGLLMSETGCYLLVISCGVACVPRDGSTLKFWISACFYFSSISVKWKDEHVVSVFYMFICLYFYVSMFISECFY